MDLSRIDLNLFTVFDAIYREGGVTAAAKQLHLSQPAISHALARLRELLNDPLFERQGSEMAPTPMARLLAAPVRGALGNLEQMLQRAGHFDPATSQRSFTIAVRESQEISFMPALLARVKREAPNIDIASVRIERRDLEDDLQSGEIDVALDVALTLSQDIRREQVRADALVVLARADHPVVQGSIDLDSYLSLGHVLVTGRRRGGGYEDAALARLGRARRIRVRCQQHAAASEIVSHSDLIATMSRHQAEVVNARAKNQALSFPLEIPALQLFLHWHANVHEDPANAWFRGVLLQILSSAQ